MSTNANAAHQSPSVLDDDWHFEDVLLGYLHLHSNHCHLIGTHELVTAPVKKTRFIFEIG